MSKFEPPKPSGPADQEPSNEIQDYLDLLLAPTADPNNAAPEVLNSERQAQADIATEPKATNKPLSPPSALASKPAAPVGRSRLSQVAARMEQERNTRPFAEPVQPVAFKLPLPKVQAPEVEAPPAAKPAAVVAPLVTPVEPVVEQAVAVEPVVAETVVAEPVAEQLAPPEEEVVAVSKAQSHPTSAWMDNGRPSWAQQRFECLLFSVGGLTLAVPLAELGSIYPITDELTPLFGQIDWFLGLLTVKQGNIRSVNTAKVVMPERYQEAMADNFNYVISINGVDWGLAVDSVASAISLNPEDVRWRSERSKRPWLAGTVVDHMCALLDVSQLALMFIERDRSRDKAK
ncbi:chemotaxis protein CheW [Dasania sp. GY-MA-18]|uniref:Chemotaxis protein CheW n=1 Tax=Dasania phycosphaerae TaxID=2950436 RepID=A0A9J6RIT4_9GAMM|nr:MULTISPECIES: chemotaxis protein CheW [Dasania]MCR8921683.1 chemotaxis protein CheW [Dasania sp. GY-MA-18]MCZ0864111.1 chemotaxis protein CheW [Dasania phycosphaerae]MCZ0867839.1 chemotaxis protein CheW [Dasania phycosphaerae]